MLEAFIRAAPCTRPRFACSGFGFAQASALFRESLLSGTTCTAKPYGTAKENHSMNSKEKPFRKEIIIKRV
jgi:hypothetical protein